MTFNFTAVVVFASFVVFMFLMKALYFDPIMKIKETRANKVADDKAEIEAALGLLEKEQAEYDAQIREARRKAQDVVIQVSQEAKQQAARTLAETRAETRQALEAKINELAEWREATYQDMREERQNLKRLILEKVVSKGSSVLSA